MSTPATRAGFVAVVGAPNAGKSTLVNGLVGSKVSIVSPKVQTTRMRVIGIAMADIPDTGEGASRAQVILVDTPGIFRVAKRRLERAMVAAAWQGADDADLVFYQALGARGEFLSGERDLPIPPEEETPVIGEVRLRDDVLRGQELRVAYTWVKIDLPGARPVLVQVAETREKRSVLATEIVKGMMLPQFAILPLAVLLVWFALVRGTRPLNDLEARVRARHPDDMSPLDERMVPLEVAPLVASVNGLLERLKDSKTPRILVLNKIDLVARETLLSLTAELNAIVPFERTFMVSALKADGVGDLLAAFALAVPAGPFLYPEDQAADLPLRLLAAEVTREQVFLQLHQELPYEAAVETEKWEDRPDGSVRVEQIIYVQREGQRAIFLGKGGARIKQIGARARHELSQMLERQVHLFLHVKVSERWAEDPSHYRTIGLDYQS